MGDVGYSDGQFDEKTRTVRKRTQSREFALQILYQIDISHAKLDEAEEDFWKDRTDLDEDSTVRKYAHQLAAGSLKNMESIDQIIERCAENWQMSRMAAVDRNILRLAAFEIIYLEEVPAKVAINEAVELAKRYGEDDSSKFVNGILDKIAKTQCKK